MDTTKFVLKLQKFKTSKILTNAYENAIIAQNFEIYLRNMLILQPDTLFVGEAPGYKGCARTGIPFTDEYNMMETENKVLGKKYGYQVIDQKCKLEKEVSAGTIWKVLNLVDRMPLMWNAFPYHPHKEDDCLSNRTPTKTETEIGIEYIKDLLMLFPQIQNVYAIGKTA